MMVQMSRETGTMMGTYVESLAIAVGVDLALLDAEDPRG